MRIQPIQHAFSSSRGIAQGISIIMKTKTSWEVSWYSQAAIRSLTNLPPLFCPLVKPILPYCLPLKFCHVLIPHAVFLLGFQSHLLHLVLAFVVVPVAIGANSSGLWCYSDFNKGRNSYDDQSFSVAVATVYCSVQLLLLSTEHCQQSVTVYLKNFGPKSK